MDGVTLRDRFAAAAMQGMLAGNVSGTSGELAAAAYAIADYMLAARKIPCRLCRKPLGDSDRGGVHKACANAENAAADRPELRLVDLGGEG